MKTVLKILGGLFGVAFIAVFAAVYFLGPSLSLIHISEPTRPY